MDKHSEQACDVPLIPSLLLDRPRLIKRWQHGSDSFFRREERAGRLLPVRHDGLLRYRFEDVLLYEGGLPSDEMAAAYAEDLMHPDEAAAVCRCSSAYIAARAKAGDIPHRMIGRARRFVAAEVARWQQDRWMVCAGRMNAKPRKTTPFTSDE